MARNESLTCVEKRDLLNQAAVSVEALLRWGQHYEEAGLVSDAVDFYEKANAVDALNKLLRDAVEEGDAFLFKRICKILNTEPRAEEWLSLARKAEELQKYRFAAEAYRQAGEEEASERAASR